MNELLKDKIFIFIIILLTFSLSALFMYEYMTIGTCAHYYSQTEAQKDILKYPHLDGNNNEKACEYYKYE